MEVLSQTQLETYRETGGLVVPGRIGPADLAAIREEIARFENEAREMTASNDRIDLEDSHTPQNPRIRRIKRPDRISDVFKAVMTSDAILGPARDILGPNIRLQTTKLNMKCAGFGAAVEWHQDWAFYPYTNDDVLAIGIMIDDMGEENGPLMIFPGTHHGPVFDHHAEGYFVGAMDLAACGLDMRDAVSLTGEAGSISIHHVRVVHGSALNVSDRSRRIAFYEMMAADAFPILGSRGDPGSLEEFEARMLCGVSTKEPRLAPVPVRIPQPGRGDEGSIYTIQKGLKNRGFAVHQEERA